MSSFDAWCDETEVDVKDHLLVILRAKQERTDIGIRLVAQTLPHHYVSPDRYSSILAKLGKLAAASYVKNKLPQSRSLRSGELGEILAVSYAEQETIWNLAAKKLRWKDHREMPMRGDDFIAIGFDDEKVLFLKGESKSRSRFGNATVMDAITTLNGNDGRPTPHALAFLSDALFHEGHDEIADRIDAAQYQDGISLSQVTHMVFAFSANDAEHVLTRALSNYTGEIDQFFVGLQVKTHADFISRVYGEVTSNGDP